MLRRLRKRRGGGALYDSDDIHGDDGGGPDSHGRGSTTGPLSAPFDEEELDDHTHQQPRMNHVLMSDKRDIDGGGRRQRTDVVGEGMERVRNSRSTQHQQHHQQQQQHPDNKILNSINVHVVSPEKPPPPKKKQPTTTSTSLQRQERARQKLDNLSRQHQQQQQHQRQHHNQYYASTALTVATPNTLAGSSEATTADTSGTSTQQLQQQQQQHQQLWTNSYNAIVHNYKQSLMAPPASSLTRHLAACTDLNDHVLRDDGIAMSGMESLESSYYSKHDFHTLPRHQQSLGADGSASLLETSYERDVRKDRSSTLEQQSNYNDNAKNISDGGGNKNESMLVHVNDYQPTPPQKRSGNSASKSAARVSQARERRKMNQQQQQAQVQQRQLHQLSQQQSGIELQVKIVNDEKHPDNDCVMLSPSPKTIDYSEDDAAVYLVDNTPTRDNDGPSTPGKNDNGNNELSIRLPTAAAAAVTPSPPSKTSKQQLRPIVRQQPESRQLGKQSILPQQQQTSQQHSVPQQASSSADEAPSSTAPTAKIVNTNSSSHHHHLIGRLLNPTLLRRGGGHHPHQKTRSMKGGFHMPTFQQHQKDQQHHQRMEEEQANEDQQVELITQSQSDLQEVQLPPTPNSVTCPSAFHPPLHEQPPSSTKQVKREEPPEEILPSESHQGEGTRQRPDPPAEYTPRQPPAPYIRHYTSSKVLDPKQQSESFVPKQKQPPAEYRHYSSKVLVESSQQQQQEEQQQRPSGRVVSSTKHGMAARQHRSKALEPSHQIQLKSQKPQYKMTAESTSQPQSKSSQNIKSLPNKKQTTNLQPPSQLKTQKQRQEAALLQQQQSQQKPEWTTPLPFKKVNSTPSNFSSFFTFQTSNSSSTSKFWEEVEEFPDEKRNLVNVKSSNSNSNQQHEKEKDEYFERHLVDVKKDPFGKAKKSLDDLYLRSHEQPATTVDLQPRTKASMNKPTKQVKSPTKSRYSSLGSIKEDDVISNAFSLKLSMNRHGAFDDSDISALQMNDSATVYFQQQLEKHAAGAGAGGAGAPSTDPNNYWKKKYDELKEETKAVLELTKSQEEDVQEMENYVEQQMKDQEVVGEEDGEQVELQEMIAHNQNPKAAPVDADATYGTLEETFDTPTNADTTHDEVHNRCTDPLDAFNQLFDGVMDFDNCEIDPKQIPQQQPPQKSDYGGGKKGRERSNKNVSCSPSDVNSSIPKEELDWMLDRAQKAKDVSVHSMMKTAEDMANFVAKIEEGIEEGNDKKKANKRDRHQKKKCSSGEIANCRNICTSVAEEMMRSPGAVSPQPHQHDHCSPGQDDNDMASPNEMSFETDDSDGQNLRPIGFVAREEQTPKSSPKYVMEEGGNDVALLQQWNKNRSVRSPKSLADDLTAGASRLSNGGIMSKGSSITEGEQSELSENAKMIFDAALKYDMKALHKQRSAARSPVRSTTSAGNASKMSSLAGGVSRAAASNFGSNIPSDFATWFELPSPGSTCIPLLPLVDVSLRNSIDVYDSMDISPRCRTDDVVDIAYADFCCKSDQLLVGGEVWDVLGNIKQSMGLIVADGDNGSVRFANASVHLPDISDAAVSAISRRQFHEAMEIYNTLLRSCQTSTGTKLGLIGKLIASTLHNLSVLHLWNQEYDQALPYCRESLRIKTELVGDDGGSVNLWANLGLINYSMGSFPSALAAFRKSVQMSSKFFPEGHLTGRLVNNMACVNFEIGKVPLVQSQYKQSLQLQKGGSNSSSVNDFTAEEDLFSISITIFNIGVVCAKESQNAVATSNIKTCLAIQQALLDDTNEVVQSTAYYLNSLRKHTSSRPPKAPSSKHGANQAMAQSNEPRKTRTAEPVTQPNEPQNPRTVEPRKARTVKPVVQPNEPYRLPVRVVEPTSADRQVNPQPQQPSNNFVHEQRGICIAPKPTHPARQEAFIPRGDQNAPFAQGDQLSHPMLSLGSLRVEATIAQRVHHSLEGCADSLASHGFDRGQQLSALMCKRPAINSNHKTVSQNIINYGLQTMKKREVQSELNRNLQRYGPRHPEVGKSAMRLGIFYLFTENYKDAAKHLDDSIRVYTNALGVKHPDVASALMFKGLAQLALERLDDSMASMLRIRRMREDALGQKHPEIGQILNNMACVQYELGQHKKAESLFQLALDLQREVFTTEPAFLKDVSIVLSNIAFLHAKSGSFPKALIELEGALQIRQDILLEDTSLSDITENMAHILAIHQLQHGAVNLDAVTEEYITMLGKSGTSS